MDYKDPPVKIKSGQVTVRGERAGMVAVSCWAGPDLAWIYSGREPVPWLGPFEGATDGVLSRDTMASSELTRAIGQGLGFGNSSIVCTGRWRRIEAWGAVRV